MTQERTKGRFSGQARYDAFSRVALEMGRSAPLRHQMEQWTLPAMDRPEFLLAVEVWLIAAPSRHPQRSSSSNRRNASRVYFVRGADRIKIGLAGDARQRLATLQSASPVVLEIVLTVVGDFDLEQYLHRRFAALRSHGEWFRAEEPLLTFIGELQRRLRLGTPR